MTIFSNSGSLEAFNRPVYGLHGCYTLSEGARIPYFATLMPLDRVIGELKIAEDISASLETKWTLTELFQREVDRERVAKDIVKGFLKDPNKLKFWNALTVVLLPRTREGKMLDAFGLATSGPNIPYDGQDPTDSVWATAVQRSDAKVVNKGGLQYAWVNDQARLRWDADRVHAVAVDGQHRLAALKLFKGDSELTTTAKGTQIPVLILLLDTECGFESPKAIMGRPIRMIAREIFTDLNKNAKRVDKARELILDDWSLEARCCRSLITDETAIDSASAIPLSLIRWQDDSNKFDADHYINSLVNLEQITRIVLDIDYPKDPMDKDDVEQFIRSVSRAVGHEGELKRESDNKDLMIHYHQSHFDNEETIAPLSRLPSDYLDSAVKGFVTKHKPWLMKVLTGLAPYKRFIGLAKQLGVIDGDFAKYQAQTHKHRVILANERGKDWLADTITKPAQQLSKLKEGNWCFKVVFQKALIILAKEICVDWRDDNALGDVDHLIAMLDHLDRYGALQTNARARGAEGEGMWVFIALNPQSQSIRAANTTVDRMHSMLKLWYFCYIIHTRRMWPELTERSDAELVSFFSTKGSSTEWPASSDAVDTLFGAFSGKYFFGQDPDELSQKKKHERQRERLALLLSIARPSAG
jgi:hypothetical protein